MYKVFDDGEDDQSDDNDTHRDQEVGIFPTKLDIAARPFRVYELLHTILAFLELLLTLLFALAWGEGFVFAVWAGLHLLHTAAHLAIVILFLLLRGLADRKLFGLH